MGEGVSELVQTAEQTQELCACRHAFSRGTEGTCKAEECVFIKCVSDRSPVNNHSSEAYFDELFFDYEIVNNGWDTMEEYYRNIDSIMRLLEVRKG